MDAIINFNALINSVNDCCLGDNSCGGCNKSDCLVGYCQTNLTTSLKSNEQFIDGGIENIPLFDTKLYDEHNVIDLIGIILNQCKNCNAYHDEECIVNLLRSACDIILFGETQDYPGSVLIFLNKINSLNPDISSKIYNSYLKHKNKV